MKWIKVEDETPKHKRDIVLYRELKNSYCMGFGFYDTEEDAFFEKLRQLPANPSH